ncbi:hypothetical protein [Nocardia salmonicida]|uniref:hypothetical protein n=1 Tax=Nocardia salmonicida TaxID=53431 RepID=UPI0007A4049A|nr:hypothetical protein [Nocardia salmonicida]
MAGTTVRLDHPHPGGSRPAPSDRRLWEIVDYIKNNGDRREAHVLEAKVDIDVSGKIGAAKIAKFILGAANRQPDVAAKYLITTIESRRS